jgi:hypothetical protein
MLYAFGQRAGLRDIAEFGDEALTGGVVRREGAGTRFDDQCRDLGRGDAEADERATEDLRVLAVGGLDGFRR